MRFFILALGHCYCDLVYTNLCGELRDNEGVSCLVKLNCNVLAGNCNLCSRNGADRVLECCCIAVAVALEHDLNHTCSLNGYLGVSVETNGVGVVSNVGCACALVVGKLNAVCFPDLLRGGEGCTVACNGEAELNFLVRNGKICEAVRGASLIGNGSQILKDIDMVGQNLATGQGMCGSSSGSVPTDVGQPLIRVSNITVGGR